MKPDGRLTGVIGGYRPWLPVYKGWIAGRGAVMATSSRRFGNSY